MIQAEIGGAARVDLGTGVQRPGFMIRDLTLPDAHEEPVRISQFRGRSNLLVVFAGTSDTMRIFLEEAVKYAQEFAAQETMVLVVVPHGPEKEVVPVGDRSAILVLYDRTHSAYRFSGATDGSGSPAPLIYLTDRFGEIVAAYTAPSVPMPPNMREILRKLEFINHQCPECEPPEWPR